LKQDNALIVLRSIFRKPLCSTSVGAGFSDLVLFWRTLRQNALQRATMHIQTPGCFRNISVAKLVNTLDMLPPDTIRRHRVLGRLGFLIGWRQ
jgi:hypothetical protein